MTGSSLPRRARSVKSKVYFFNASRWPSASALFTDSPPRTTSIAASKALRVKPFSRAALPNSPLSSAITNKKSSPAINWSPRLFASFSVRLSQPDRSRPTCTSPLVPCTSGKPSIIFCVAFSNPATLTPARVNKLRAAPSRSRNMAMSKCAGSMYWLSLVKAMLCASFSASWNLLVNLSILMIYLKATKIIIIWEYKGKSPNCKLKYA